MKFTHALIGAVVAALFSLPASADQIQGLYNTGVMNNGTPLANGATDTHFTVNGSGPAFVNQNPAYPVPADARFISPQAGGSFSQNPNTFSQTFDLTGFNPATAMISGMIGADDQVTIRLNGNAVFSGSGFALVPFSIMTGFISGVNTLSYVVTDVFGPPSSFVVSGIQGTASLGAVAAPGPIAGAGIPALLVLTGFWVVRRRRHQATA